MITFADLLVSNTAMNNGIQNVPGKEEAGNLRVLYEDLLLTIWEKVGPFLVTSGYRCLELNRLLGSKDNSQHTKGQAADLHFIELTSEEALKRLRSCNISYDQAIVYEDKTILHISYKNPVQNRMQSLYKAAKGGYKKIP